MDFRCGKGMWRRELLLQMVSCAFSASRLWLGELAAGSIGGFGDLPSECRETQERDALLGPAGPSRALYLYVLSLPAPVTWGHLDPRACPSGSRRSQ